MPTFVTRVVVTQIDDYQPPEHDLTTKPGSQVWVVEWTKTTGPLFELHSVQHSIGAARRLTMNLLAQRPPGTEVNDVLTLIGMGERGDPPGRPSRSR